MSSLDAVLPRPSVLADSKSRWTWGPEPRRFVRVIVSDDEGVRVARVYGATGRQVEILQVAEVSELTPSNHGWDITTTDGERWLARFDGCSSCQGYPGVLARLSAQRAPR